MARAGTGGGDVKTLLRSATVRLYHRIAVGAEAGALSGASVVLLFFLQDAVRLDPLATPQALSMGLFGVDAIRYDAGIVSQVAAWSITGVGLLAYTVLHFLAFAGVGIVGSFLLRAGSWWSSLAGGAVFGATFCTAVFYGSRWVMTTPVQLASVGFPSVLLANVVAGVVLGGGLFVALGSADGAGDKAAA